MLVSDAESRAAERRFVSIDGRAEHDVAATSSPSALTIVPTTVNLPSRHSLREGGQLTFGFRCTA
jgi:hypothetical protein